MKQSYHRNKIYEEIIASQSIQPSFGYTEWETYISGSYITLLTIATLRSISKSNHQLLATLFLQLAIKDTQLISTIRQTFKSYFEPIILFTPSSRSSKLSYIRGALTAPRAVAKGYKNF